MMKMMKTAFYVRQTKLLTNIEANDEQYQQHDQEDDGRDEEDDDVD